MTTLEPITSEPEVLTPRRPVPATPRGRRSRQALLDAARIVFGRDGFSAARITDIADAAGAAHGSFYTYFTSKEDIFLALIEELEQDLSVSRAPRVAHAGPYERIRSANREYLTAYHANREVMVVWEQAASLHPEVAEQRNAASDRAAARVERAIRAMQAEKTVDASLDAAYAAFALTGMVSSFAYRWSQRELPFELDEAVEQLSALWANALGVPRR